MIFRILERNSESLEENTEYEKMPQIQTENMLIKKTFVQYFSN